jgi:hypothetical protein
VRPAHGQAHQSEWARQPRKTFAGPNPNRSLDEEVVRTMERGPRRRPDPSGPSIFAPLAPLGEIYTLCRGRPNASTSDIGQETQGAGFGEAPLGSPRIRIRRTSIFLRR